jgi:hypothetical protein
VKLIYHDEISPFLEEVQRELAKGGNKALDEAGALMTHRVVNAMEAQRGLQDGRRYAPWTKSYKKKRGPGRILFLLGDLANSWRWRVEKWGFVIFAGGLEENAIKASAHDGGVAERTGKGKWNRLRLGWRDRDLQRVGQRFMDRLVDDAARRSRRRRW